MSQILVPFVIAANTVTSLRSVKLPTDRGTIRLVVLDGGPVYAWIGREVSIADAVKLTTTPTDSDQIDYDLAGVATGTPVDLDVPEGGTGTITVFSTTLTHGFLLLQSGKRANN